MLQWYNELPDEESNSTVSSLTASLVLVTGTWGDNFTDNAFYVELIESKCILTLGEGLIFTYSKRMPANLPLSGTTT